MNAPTKKAATQRLARIAGQVRGIDNMIKGDRYCIDVIRQVQAVKAALAGLERVILEDHIDSCVDAALKSEKLSDRQEKVQELVAVLAGGKK